MTKLHELGVVEAAAAIRQGELTAEQLSSALLARADVQKQLNAFVTSDADAVLKAARDADAQRKAGSRWGRCTACRSRSRTTSIPQLFRPPPERQACGSPAEAERAGGAGAHRCRRDRVRQAGDA